MRKVLPLLIVFVFLIGCVTHGPVKSKYPPDYSSKTPATIVIERPSVYAGSAINFEVTINGEAVWGIQNHEQIVFQVNPGETSFGALGVNPWSLEPAHHQIMIDCEPGETYYLLVQYHLNIAPTIERVSMLKIKE